VRVDNALRSGFRGLTGGSSLVQLMAKHRGARNISSLPRLSVDQILTWVDLHYRRTGQWPTKSSGSIIDAPGEKWGNVHQALRKGLRGLPGGSTLSILIKQKRR
jgi:hypothetical protein